MPPPNEQQNCRQPRHTLRATPNSGTMCSWAQLRRMDTSRHMARESVPGSSLHTCTAVQARAVKGRAGQAAAQCWLAGMA
jgi:hypothetical protein